LIANTTVYAPGDVPKGGGQISAPVTLPSEPQHAYIALHVPEPTDLEFKTPDQIIAAESQPSEQEFIPTDSGVYKPKAIPFTSKVPIPVPVPKEFQIPKIKNFAESFSVQTPFGIMRRKEPPKPQPASMTFEPTPQPQQELVSEPPFFQAQVSQPDSMESLVDYMPQTIISKKELKRLAKEKKKLDKEKAILEKEKKISEKRKKQGEIVEAMKTSKKDKKEKQLEPTKSKPERGSLFQTLTQRTEHLTTSQSAFFMPFTGESKTKEEGKSKLRIIPNVADIDIYFTPPGCAAITSIHPVQEEKQNGKKKELIKCDQCGFILSSDYAFCNKCGNKL